MIKVFALIYLKIIEKQALIFKGQTMKPDMNYRKIGKEELIRQLESLQAKLESLKAAGESSAVLHDLQVHQIELEMQNRALQESQQHLEAARNRYVDLYDFAPIGYVSLDENGVVLDINLTGAAMLGQERSRIIGLPYRKFIDEADGKIFYGHIRRCKETKEKSVDEVSLLRAGKDRFRAELQSIPVYDELEKQISIRTVVVDVTERRKIERRMLELSMAIEQSPSMVIVGTIDGNIEYVNPRFTEVTGYGPDEVIGRNISILESAAHEPEFYGQLWNAVRAGLIWRGDICSKRKNGSGFWQLTSVAPLRVFSDAVTHFVAVEIDDTERKSAEEALAAEKERLFVILQSIGEGVITMDNNGRVSFINKEGEELTGWTPEDFSGRPLFEVLDLVSEKTGERYENPAGVFFKMHTDPGFYENMVLVDRHGRKKIITGEMAPIKGKDGRVTGMVLIFRDVTARSRMADELLKIQKLESVVVLAGGLAAEFNKLLNLIKGNIELAKDSMPPGDSYDRLSEAEKVVNMTRDLSHQLLTLSPGGEPVKDVVYIEEMLRDAIGFALSGSETGYEAFFPDDLWFVEVDEEQVGQVFRNVLQNAVQSMPGGGKLSVSCENIAAEESEKYNIKKKRYVKISIKDTGTGIPKEHLQKVFDPFFTTQMKGSGLGLTIAYSIIKKHGGFITIESEPGSGTIVHIFLPASEYQKRKKTARAS